MLRNMMKEHREEEWDKKKQSEAPTDDNTVYLVMPKVLFRWRRLLLQQYGLHTCDHGTSASSADRDRGEACRRSSCSLPAVCFEESKDQAETRASPSSGTSEDTCGEGQTTASIQRCSTIACGGVRSPATPHEATGWSWSRWFKDLLVDMHWMQQSLGES